MSKTVRIKQHLADELQKLADQERRSLANLVEILLEQALRIDQEPRTKTAIKTEPAHVQTQSTTSLRNERAADPHFKPDFK